MTTPQKLAHIDVIKGIDMFDKVYNPRHTHTVIDAALRRHITSLVGDWVESAREILCV